MFRSFIVVDADVSLISSAPVLNRVFFWVLPLMP